jgi:hypothetical protein
MRDLDGEVRGEIEMSQTMSTKKRPPKRPQIMLELFSGVITYQDEASDCAPS